VNPLASEVRAEVGIDRNLQRLIPHHAEAQSLAEARLERLRDDLQKRGAQDVRVELVEGSVKQEVVARARQSEFSLVVIGSQGQGFITGVALGSVSHAVAYQATVPVLFVPLPR
jgi:nucleotide-binding universal stress UspA family protein